MGTNNLLSCLDKRDLLNLPAASVETLMEWGDRYLEAGFVHDAVDFYAKAGAAEALSRIIDAAKIDGDIFLLRRLGVLLGREPTAEEWLTVAEQAEHLGKYQFACKGFQAAEAQDRCDALRSRMANSSGLPQSQEQP